VEPTRADKAEGANLRCICEIGKLYKWGIPYMGDRAVNGHQGNDTVSGGADNDTLDGGSYALWG